MENIQSARDTADTAQNDARYRATSEENRLNRESHERISQAEIKARIQQANISAGSRPDHLSPILKFTSTAMDDIQNAIRSQQTALANAMTEEEKTAAKAALAEMSRKRDTLYAVQAKELEKQYPGQGFSELFKPAQEFTIDEIRSKLPARGDVPKASNRDAAVKGLKSLIPGLPDLSQLGGALSKLKSVNPMTGRPWVAEN